MPKKKIKNGIFSVFICINGKNILLLQYKANLMVKWTF